MWREFKGRLGPLKGKVLVLATGGGIGLNFPKKTWGKKGRGFGRLFTKLFLLTIKGGPNPLLGGDF